MHCVFFFLFLLFLIYSKPAWCHWPELLNWTVNPNFMGFSTDFVLRGPLVPPYYLLLTRLCCDALPSVSSTCCWTGDSLSLESLGSYRYAPLYHADTMGSPSGLNGSWFSRNNLQRSGYGRHSFPSLLPPPLLEVVCAFLSSNLQYLDSNFKL